MRIISVFLVSLLVFTTTLTSNFRQPKQEEPCRGNCCITYPNGVTDYLCKREPVLCKFDCVCFCTWVDENQFEKQYKRIVSSERIQEYNCKLRYTTQGNPNCNADEIMWTKSDCLQVYGGNCNQKFSTYDHCPTYEYPLFGCEIISE